MLFFLFDLRAGHVSTGFRQAQPPARQPPAADDLDQPIRRQVEQAQVGERRRTEERRQRSGRPKTEERRMLALVQVQLVEQVAWEIRSYLTRPGVLGLYPHLRVKNSTPRTMASRHTAPS